MQEVRGVLLAALIAVAAAAPAARAAAQEVPGPDLQLVPKIGMSMPLGSLADNTEIGNSLALGLAAELVLPRLPFGIRANLDFARAADVVERSPAEPVLGTATILAVTGDIVLRPLPPTALARPYFLGGAGIRRLEFDIDAGTATELSSGTLTRATLHVGGGLDVRFGPLSMVLEVSDYISTMPADEGSARIQNDIFGMIGFRVGMF